MSIHQNLHRGTNIRIDMQHIVHPLGQVIAAYKTPRKKYHGARALDILKEADSSFTVVARCGGWPAVGSNLGLGSSSLTTVNAT